MEYRAVGNKCAVVFEDLELPVNLEEAIAILKKIGFRVIDVDFISLARSCIGKSVYCRGALPQKAPKAVDCSGFVKWLYGEKGIWLPRRSIQQRDVGHIVNVSNIKAGDLVFTSGYIDYYYSNSKDGVGHVGIATNDGTVIHAASKNHGVVETSFVEFVGKERQKLRGIRRYVYDHSPVITVESPSHRIIETSSDLRWIILQSM